MPTWNQRVWKVHFKRVFFPLKTPEDQKCSVEETPICYISLVVHYNIKSSVLPCSFLVGCSHRPLLEQHMCVFALANELIKTQSPSDGLTDTLGNVERSSASLTLIFLASFCGALGGRRCHKLWSTINSIIIVLQILVETEITTLGCSSSELNIVHLYPIQRVSLHLEPATMF